MNWPSLWCKTFVSDRRIWWSEYRFFACQPLASNHLPHISHHRSGWGSTLWPCTQPVWDLTTFTEKSLNEAQLPCAWGFLFFKTEIFTHSWPLRSIYNINWFFFLICFCGSHIFFLYFGHGWEVCVCPPPAKESVSLENSVFLVVLWPQHSDGFEINDNFVNHLSVIVRMGAMFLCRFQKQNLTARILIGIKIYRSILEEFSYIWVFKSICDLL